jgi:hypothetical protein
MKYSQHQIIAGWVERAICAWRSYLKEETIGLADASQVQKGQGHGNAKGRFGWWLLLGHAGLDS